MPGMRITTAVLFRAFVIVVWAMAKVWNYQGSW